MIYVTIREQARPANRRLGFYLAMEEYIARHREEDGLFFMWQVDPTVICGRNQEVELETDLDYCKSENIDVIRRKSGGGCVFADRSNVMFSYISHSTDVETTFSGYTSMVAAMLRELGLDASDNSRNDILIGDRKVSGCAFYHLPGRSIVHGTMLYDTDGKHISKALTPSRAKLTSKGVKSVKSRITTIKEHVPNLTLDEFKRHARESLCGAQEIILEDGDIKIIEEIEKSYYEPEWTFRTMGRHGESRQERIDGVGEMKIIYSVDGTGKISELRLTGDYFGLGENDDKLLQLLKGTAPTEAAVRERLSETDVSQLIAGLDNDRLAKMFGDK